LQKKKRSLGTRKDADIKQRPSPGKKYVITSEVDGKHFGGVSFC